MKSSQKQNILRHLLYGPLCGQEADWSLGRRIPARIHELRKAGFQIGKRECDQGHDHRTRQVEFYIEEHVVTNYMDWCADCGSDGALRLVSGAADKQGDGWFWLPHACSECGKGDWR